MIKYNPEHVLQQKISQLQLNDKINKFQNTWQVFALKHYFHPKTGIMIEPDFQTKSFNSEQLEKIINLSANQTSFQTYLNAIKSIKPIQASQITCYKELIILKDSLSYVLTKLMIISRRENKPIEQIKIPQNIARPLYQSSLKLQTKFGLSAALSFNWKILSNNNKIQQKTYTLDTIDLRWYFTQNKEQEKIFMGTSVLGAIQMAKVIKSCYQINQLILDNNLEDRVQTINSLLQMVSNSIGIIADSCKQMIKNFDGDYFWKILRNCFVGFKNLYFQGINEHLSSSGASAGQDSSYIMFQKAFGIYYTNSLSKIQQNLKLGMFGKHKQIQNYFEKNTQIRSFCQSDQRLKQSYNQVIDNYSKFYQIHSCLISKYVLSNVDQKDHHYVKGVGDNTIADLINRWKTVRQFKLK